MIDILNLSGLFYLPPGSGATTGPVLDQSVSLLNKIFGAPIQVLLGSPGASVAIPGTSHVLEGSLLTEVLHYFNTGLLFIAFVIFGYVTFVGTVHTARDGRFLGKLDSHWTPLRLIFGPTAMLPIKGFSLAQYLVMYFILVGVNLADNVWRNALDQIEVQPPAGMPAAVDAQIAKEVGTVFVYKAIQKSIAHFVGDHPITVDVHGGSLNIFGQYQDKFKESLYDYCGYEPPVAAGQSSGGSQFTLPAANKYAKLCSLAVNALFANQVTSIFFPAGPVPIKNTQGSSKFVNIYLSLGGNTAGLSGASGGAFAAQYVFDPCKSLNPRIQVLRIGETIPSGAKIISKPDTFPIYILLPQSDGNACTATTSALTMSAVSSASSPIVTKLVLPPKDVTTDWIAKQLSPMINTVVVNNSTGIVSSTSQDFAYQTSFAGIISEITAYLKTELKKKDDANGDSLLGKGIPGTGYTCASNGLGSGHYQCMRNGQPVKAVQFANSWWYASDIYLNLNARLAKNINDLAAMVGQFQLQPGQITFGSVVGSTCPDSKDSTCVKPAIDVTMAAIQYNSGDSTHEGKANPMTLARPIIGLFGLNTTAVGNEKTKKGKISGTIHLPPINSKNLNMMFRSWSDLICPYQSSFSSQTSGVIVDPIEFCNAQAAKAESSTQEITSNQNSNLTVHKNLQNPDSFYQLLVSMPEAYQVPIGALLYLTEQAPSKLYCHNKPGCTITNQQALNNTRQIISNIITVLVANHVYPGSQTQPASVNSQGEISPVQRMVQQAINHITGKRLPGNYTPIPTSSQVVQNASNTVGQIFYEIYQLGNQAPSSWQDVVNTSFNNIANAQRIGLMMISTVVNSVEATSAFIQNTMNGFIHSDRKIVKNIETTAGWGGGVTAIASGLSAIPGGFGTAAALTAIASQLGTQIGVMVQQIQLQQKLVDQNYDMMMDLMWLPVGIMVATLMFTAGLSFSLVVPLIPYILFWAGQIAWLLGVIEAMIAAPLLALALTHPGGHETWGHTVPGLRMLIGVILRPVLMIIGLITGLILTFVVIKFSSQGFQIISTEILSYAGSVGHYGSAGPSPYGASAGALLGPNATVTQGVMAVLMLFLFCSFMVMAFNKCFSTIYIFPEKVVQWFGGQAMAAGKEEAQQMSQTASQTGGQMAQAGGQSMQSGGQAASSNTQQQGQAGMAKGEKSLGMGQAAGKAGGEAGGSIEKSRSGSSTDDEGKGPTTDD